MRFPGQRIAKHYFPVTRTPEIVSDERHHRGFSVVGLDQIIVDMEVRAAADFASDLGVVPDESVQLDPDRFATLLARISARGVPCRFAPGGTVANTLNNFTHLSGERALLLGAIPECIRPREPAFHFVAQTPKAMRLDHLLAVPGEIGTAITFVNSDGDRCFAVAPGVSNAYRPTDIPQDVYRGATTVLVSLYTLADPSLPITHATLRLIAGAVEAKVPVAFSLGTAGLVRRMRAELWDLLARDVTICAMNHAEAEALTGEPEVLLSCERILDVVDLAVITQGKNGMTIGGYVDHKLKRQTRQPIVSSALPEYNRYEFSRLMRRADCQDPLKIYTHIHPYQGGPSRLHNTSGAGDAALAALLHDIAANQYHRASVPDSAKHTRGGPFLSYSSLSRNAQYGNRVAYEVLRGASPRLDGPVGPDR